MYEDLNLLLLLFGFRVWSGPPVEMLTRALCALSLLALEMQLATWTGMATLATLVPINMAVAAALFLSSRHAGMRRAATDGQLPAAVHVRRLSAPAAVRAWAPFAALGLLVVVMNAALPLEAADPYHLERVDRIAHTGTLAYDAAAHPKVNVLGWLYELALADLRALPIAGQAAVRFHGTIALLVYALTSAAVFQIIAVPVPPAAALLAAIPVVFHQFVMVKNDLFGAIPAVLVLAWVVTADRHRRRLDTAWAAWLTGLAVGVKLTSFPLAAIFASAIVVRPLGLSWRIAAAAAGAVSGLVSAGLLFVLVENVAVYGDAVEPLAALGNRTASPGDGLLSVARFALSLADMGLATPAIWPGRGGWGGTYGLPLIWALCVLASAHRTPLARRTLLVCAGYWLAFAAVYPDADAAHRLALAPGLLAIAVAAAVADGDRRVPPWLRRLALPIGVLSAVQIVRSAILYFVRASS